MVIVTHESYDSVLVGTGKARVTAQMQRGEAGRIDGGTRNRKRHITAADCFNTINRTRLTMHFNDVRCGTGYSRLRLLVCIQLKVDHQFF